MLCICAVGMTFVIISGGIDLSMGSILGASGIITAALLQIKTVDPLTMTLISIVIGLLAGILLGAWNGFLIAVLRLPPFIATLAMMSIIRGIVYIITNGAAIYNFPDISRNVLEVVPVPIVIMVAILALGYYILKFTKIGRYTYAIGGNENASTLSGINVIKYKIIVYAIAGLCAGIAGMIMTSRMNAAVPIAGQNYELNAIAAVVIGGASMTGGEGHISGTIIGMLIIGVINNGMNMLLVAQGVQMVVLGGIMLIAVLLDIIRQRQFGK
jgi:ribose transport system permease protein